MTKEEALIKAKKEWVFLIDYPEWNNDKEMVLAAVQQDSCTLQYASGELKNNKDIVMAAVKQNGLALQYTSEELKNNKEVVMAAIQQNGKVLQYVSDELRNNKEVVLAAVQKSGWALRFASEELKNDKGVALIAVQQKGLALQFVSDELRNDKEIVLTAIARDIDACEFSLLEDYKTFEKVIKKDGEDFLFSCWKNEVVSIRIQVANHPNFLPTLNQIEIGLQDESVQEIYKLRKDEWLAKVEENKLMNII